MNAIDHGKVASRPRAGCRSSSMYRGYLQVMSFRILVENGFDPGSWHKGSRVVKGVTSSCDNGSRRLSFA